MNEPSDNRFDCRPLLSARDPAEYLMVRLELSSLILGRLGLTRTFGASGNIQQ